MKYTRIRPLHAICVLVLALLCALPATGRTQVGEPIFFHALFSQTGVAAPNSRLNLLGAQLAVEQINAAGGLLGRPLELCVLDVGSTPLGALKAAKKAIRMGAVAVIGPTWSSQSMAAAPVLQQAGVPMLTPSATATAITPIGDFIFRVCHTNEHLASAAARFFFESLGARRAVVLTNIDEIYSQDLSRRFLKAFADLGGSVPLNLTYRRDAVDFSSQLAAIAEEHPDAVFLPGYEKDGALIIRQAERTALHLPFVGGDGFSSLPGQYAGALQVFMISPKLPSDMAPLDQGFASAFQSRFPDVPAHSFLQAQGYDALLLLARAVQKARSLDRRQIRNALAETSSFKGASGNICFDAQGDPMSKSLWGYALMNNHWNILAEIEGTASQTTGTPQQPIQGNLRKNVPPRHSQKTFPKDSPKGSPKDIP